MHEHHRGTVEKAGLDDVELDTVCGFYVTVAQS
jgi:hypothetical protein